MRFRIAPSRDHTLKLWDARELTERATLVGHTDDVTSAAFSPDGGRIASVSWDSTLRVWDVPSGEELLSFRAHQDYAFAVAFSPDGTWLASSAKSIKLWETTCPDPAVLEQRRARVAAEDLVETLSAELEAPADVIARIKLEPGISDDVRQLAIQTACFRRP